MILLAFYFKLPFVFSIYQCLKIILFSIFRIFILAENLLRENYIVTSCFNLGFGDNSHGFNMYLTKKFSHNFKLLSLKYFFDMHTSG